MLQCWKYSLTMLVVYVGVFSTWKLVPSRGVFLVGGALAVAYLLRCYFKERQNGYFLNRVDATLHALVIVDLIIESFIFEAFRLFQPNAVVEQFHNNMNFVGCTLAFVLVIGGHRWFVLRGRGDVLQAEELTASSSGT